MATLTTVDGVQYNFAAKAVAIVADHDASTGEAVTCVYGVTKGMLKINETVQGFLIRLKVAQNFGKLTRPNGAPVWICGPSVSAVRAPSPDEYVDGVQSLIFTPALTQGVKESPQEAITELNKHHGDL